MRAMIQLVGMGLLLAGCPMNDDDTEDSADSADTGDVKADATVSGAVSRTAPLAEDGDGIGTLFVAAFETCAHDGTVLGVSVTPGADVSSEMGSVPWSISGLPQQTVYLALFLDDDGNADPAAPLPDDGDLVYGSDAEDGLLDCVAVDLSSGDLADVALELDLLEAPDLADVSGTVSRSAPLAPDGDGIGLLLVAALDSCAFTATILGSSVTPTADLSSESASVPFSIADLPQGPVHLALFLDDDGNADLTAPLPDVGDLVYGLNAGDGNLDCVEVDLSGGDTSGVALELNLLEE